jgi:hypothetical protein
MYRTGVRIVVLFLLVLYEPMVAAQATQPNQGALRATSQREVTAGIKAGLNVSRLTSDEGYDPRLGLIAGVFVARPLGGVVGVEIDGLYSLRGEKYFDTTIAMDYLEIPILATFTVAPSTSLRPMFYTGPTPAFKLRTRYGDSADLAFDEFVRISELGWMLGGGIDIPRSNRRLTLEGRYTFGLTPVFDAEPDDLDREKRHRVFSILLAYRFIR